jgi:uncharacterized membrane protein
MMHDPSIEARVARLERKVDEIHRALRAGDPTGNSSGVGAAHPPDAMDGAITTTAASEPSPRDRSVTGPAEAAERLAVLPSWRVWIWDSELWLNKLGVGLLLFGVTFLFKYSIDQGWLTPAVRVGFGAAVGLALLGCGLRLGDRQRSLSQVLLGGGVATFYIVGFAAFQLYELVGYTTAFMFMVSVTLLTFLLAVREDHAVLSLIGVKGALGTPFLLYSGAGNFAWLIAYSCLVIASAVALFLLRGWRSVLWTAVLGGWAVFTIAYTISLASVPPSLTVDRWMFQAAVLFAGVAFALLPAIWEVRWGAFAREIGADAYRLPDLRLWRLSGALLDAHIYLLTILTPVAALGLSGLAWSLSWQSWGGITLAVGIGYAAVGAMLLGRYPVLGNAHLLTAALLLPIGTLAAFGGDRLYVAIAAEAALFHAVARRWGLRGIPIVAHLLLAGCAVWFLVRLDIAGIARTPRALADLVVLGFVLAASLRLANSREILVYRLAVHAALLAWLWRELSPLPNGAAYVTTAWAVYGLALLVLGLRHRLDLLQKTALLTLLLMVAKLFAVDLAALEALWRVLLFLAMGGLFLLLSYLLQGLWTERARVTGR